MAARGDIQTFSVAAICRMIHAEKKTGILEISSGIHSTRFYFKNGAIVFIQGDVDEEFSLDALLLADNLIARHELQQAKEIARRSGKRLGDVLYDQRLVAKDDLNRTIHNQFREAVAKTLSFQEGVFEYSDALDVTFEDPPTAIDPARLLAEAEQWKEFRILIPTDHAVFRIKDARVRSDAFQAEEDHRVMLMIDGTRNVYDIIQQTGLSRIAVYKALRNLFLKGVIARELPGIDKESTKYFGKRDTMGVFLRVTGEILADISMEMGNKKAMTILDNAFRQTDYYAFFHAAMDVGKSTETNIQSMSSWMAEKHKDISAEDLNREFSRIAVFMLREEYRHLGLKSLTNTIRRLVKAVEKMSSVEQRIAGNLTGFLSRVLNDEKELMNTESALNRLTTNGGPEVDSESRFFPELSQIGAEAIISFYGRVIQVVMADLEKSIGSKSKELFQKIISSSQYNEKFLSQYNVNDDIKTNVERIRQYIADKGYRLGKIGFINGFQQVLLALLMEEKDLLGDKSAGESIMKIEKLIPRLKSNQLKYLAENLMQTLKSQIGV